MVGGNPMGYKVFTEEQVQHFIEKGWVKLEQAIPRETALAAQDVVWTFLKERHGIDKDDQSTWTKGKVHLFQTGELYETPEFMSCNTERLFDGIEDLVGEGRNKERVPNAGFGTLPVNFYDGKDRPWTVPKRGWHYDGDFFTHYVDSSEQGLLVLGIFSDIGVQGGGTLVVEGSQHVVAKVLSDHPDGLTYAEANQAAIHSNPWLAELAGASTHQKYSVSNVSHSYNSIFDENEGTDPNAARVEKFMNQTYETPEGYKLRVVETTGHTGDVIMVHPFLLHAASQNHSGIPRFLGNRKNSLYRRMNLHRDNPADYSAVETAIRNALFPAVTSN
jgi:hypothetical protein